MKRRSFVLAAVGGTALAAGAGLSLIESESRTSASAISEKGTLRAHASAIAVPNFPFENADGVRRTLADFHGRFVLLNAWATWCTPCREEMPSLDRLEAKLGGPDFHVLALSVDTGGADTVRKFYAELGLRTLGIYVDRTLKVNSALRIQGLPSTVLLDRNGREIARHVGAAEWDTVKMIDSIKTLMRQGTP